jgi:hypothetical protein
MNKYKINLLYLMDKKDLFCYEKMPSSGDSFLSGNSCYNISPRPYNIKPQNSADIYGKNCDKEQLRFSFPEKNTESFNKALNAYKNFKRN